MAKIDPLPRGEPESQGMSSKAILDFLKAASEKLDSLHGFMILRHGVVVAEGSWAPFRLEGPHQFFSLSKSFTSTAIGLAVAEGRLSVEDAVVSFFPHKLPSPVPARLSGMKVKHLLSMNTGHHDDTTDRIMRDRDPVRAFLALPVEHDPGSHFVYNSGASFMLSAILQELTGKRLSDYLNPRLFDKLGIEGAKWDRHPCGIDFGGWGFNARLEDVARFGQLYLQKGEWKGERILSEAWIAEATGKQSENADPEKPDPKNDWQQGYGYQFWRCKTGCYRGDGAFGQLCVVMPEQDAVVALFAGLSDMQAEFDSVWDYLQPAMSKAALAPDPSAVAELRAYAEGLALKTPQAAANSGGAALGGGRYSFGENWAGLDWASVEYGEDFATFRYRLTRRKPTGNGLDGPLDTKRPLMARSLKIGYGEWLEGVSWLDGSGPRKAASSGAWIAPDTFEMRIFQRETPYIMTLVSKYEGDKVTISTRLNVNMGPLEFPPLEGHLI